MPENLVELQPASDKPSPIWAHVKLAAALLVIVTIPVLAWRAASIAPIPNWRAVLGIIAPRSAGDYWTAVLALSTAALMAVAYRGLKSLGLTRRDILSRATREARESAVRQAEAFSREILHQGAELTTKFRAAKVPVFVQNVNEVRFDPDTQTDIPRAQAWHDAMPEPIRQECVKFLNNLEAWAMRFTCGLADRDIAYGPCATAYFSLVIQFYPLLLLFRQHRLSGKYPNTVALYLDWREKREAEGQGAQLTELLSRLNELQRKMVRGGTPLPPPIGTDID